MKKLAALAIAAALTVGPLATIASAGNSWSGNSWSSQTDGKRQH